MRITILTDRYAPEARAAAYLSRELAEGLARRGHQVAVIARMPTQFVPENEADAQSPADAVPAAETVAGVRITRVRALSGSPRIWLRALDQLTVSIRMALALWAAPRPDVVLVYSPPLALTLAALLDKWVRRRPFVLNLHDLYPQTAIDLGVLRNPALIWLARRVESLVYRSADRIVVAAPASKRILTGPQRISADRVELIFNYFDTEPSAAGTPGNGFRERHGVEGCFVVLYAGLMGLAQDLTPVLAAARQTESDAEWVFVLAGDGPCAFRWARLSRGLKNVKMIGPLSYAAYFEALQAADVCLVALSAAFKAPAVPGKVPAIMAAGRPIVASVPAGNDTRQILAAAGAGIAVDPERPEELLGALALLKNRPELGREWGANGARYAALHFKARTAVEKFEQILREVGTSGGRQSVSSKAKVDAV